MNIPPTNRIKASNDVFMKFFVFFLAKIIKEVILFTKVSKMQ